MKEKSFILLKPDAINRPEVVTKIVEMVNKAGLRIENTNKVILTKNDIVALWGYLVSDYIMFNIMADRFTHKELVLYVIEGEDALNKVHSIKRFIRNKYALNSLDNCIHAPRSVYEYKKDIHVLNKIETYATIDEPMNIYKLNRYSQLTLKDLTECSHKIGNMLNANENIENKYSNSGRYCLYLYDDEEHLPGYVAGILYEALNELSLEECYMICIWVGSKGKICIVSNDNYDRVLEIQKFLSQYMLKTEIVEKVKEIKEDIEIIDWKIITDCQCACEFCYASNRVECINNVKYKDIVECIKKLNCRKVCVTGGEPLLNRNIGDILQMLHSNRIEISLSTNGLMYDQYRDIIEKCVGRMSLPLDGYNNISNACNGRPIDNFDKIVAILERNNKLGNKIKIKIATVMTSKNANIEHFKKMYEFISKYNVMQWKIYELVAEGRGYENRDELNVDIESIQDILEYFEEINNQQFKVEFVRKNSRNRAYFMIQPNGDIVVPTEVELGHFEDIMIGNFLKDSVANVYNKWTTRIDFEVYRENCTRRI